MRLLRSLWIWAHSCLPPAGGPAVPWLTGSGFSRDSAPRDLLILQPASLALFSCWWQSENRSMQSPWWLGLAEASHQPTQIPGTGKQTPPSEEKILRVTGKGLQYRDRKLCKCLGRKSNIPGKPRVASLDITFRPSTSLGSRPSRDFILRWPHLAVAQLQFPLKGKSEESGQEGKRKTLPVSSGLYHLSTRTSNTSKPVLWPSDGRSKLPCPSALGRQCALLWLMRWAASKDWTRAYALCLYYRAWVFAMRKAYPG